MTFKTQIFTAMALASLAMAAAPAGATEGGGNSYPVGVETNFSGLMPPEGLHAFVYYTNYAANESKDNSGNNNPQLAYFKLRSSAVVGRLSYVWPGVRVLGANVETRVAQALPSIAASAGINRPAPLGVLDRSGSRTDLADTVFAPVILGWHSPTFHQMAGVETILPTGSYDSARVVNAGRNTLQVAPFYALTWFPSKGFDVNAKFRFAVNSKNNATNYQSGNEASVEFSAGYQPNPSLTLGLNGYIYQQTSNDVQNGALVNGNGNRGRVKALGPYIGYSFTPRFQVMLKLQSEFDAVNRPQGTRFWIQTKIPF
ncbi:MAG: transporter [Pseudomonadota bacterium]